MRNSRKGQVTIFIIIGIVLLIIAGIGIYLFNSTGVANLTDTEFESTKTVDTNLRPIKMFVEKCMNDVGSKALKKIGRQGGYIQP